MSYKIEDALEGTSRSLIDALDDPDRRIAEEKLGRTGDGRTHVILEGRVDVRFFKKHGDEEKHLYRRLSSDYRLNGKRKIISEVNGTSDIGGVVDMDHDFQGSKLGSSGRLYDTRDGCCLFSLALGGKLRGNLIEATRRILQSLLVNSDAFIEANGKLREREQEFIDSVKEITAAKMFRGHLGDEGYRFGSEGEMEAEWSDIGDSRLCTIHLIPPDFVERFSEFKESHREDIERAGINDHALRDVLLLLLTDTLDEERVPKLGTINWKIGIAMERFGRREDIQRILDGIELAMSNEEE